jgi:tRNA U55 pseudouridine synthase TruB
MYSIGTDLGTLARTRRLRRVRQGPFTLDHALLDKKFHVMPILRNILMSNQMVKTALTEDPDVIQVGAIQPSTEGRRGRSCLLPSSSLQVKEQSELASRAMVEKFRLDVKHLEEDAPEPDDCLYLQWGRDYEK